MTSMYETLLLDFIAGDATSFVRADLEEAAWRALEPIILEWNSSLPPPFPNYEAGTWGPQAANDLLNRDGRRWLLGDQNLS